MSNTQPFDYQLATSTDDIMKILYWKAGIVQFAKTPTPKEFEEERVYEMFLNSDAFKAEVEEAERLLYKEPNKLPKWNE